MDVEAEALRASVRSRLFGDVGLPSIGLFGASPPLHHSKRIHVVKPDDEARRMDGIDIAQVRAAVDALGLLPSR